jgi:O-antigen ligase
MDFLKVFAETGVIGFLLLLVLLSVLVRTFYRSYRRIPLEHRSRYLAFAVGATGILLNMAIGYELLHAFFWINIAALLYFVDRARAASRTVQEKPPSQAEWQPLRQ